MAVFSLNDDKGKSLEICVEVTGIYYAENNVSRYLCGRGVTLLVANTQPKYRGMGANLDIRNSSTDENFNSATCAANQVDSKET
jgi:hypothetical protein